MHAKYFTGSARISDLARGDDALDQVVGVKLTGGIFNPDAAVMGVGIDEAGVTVAGDNDKAGKVVEGCAAGFEG